MRKRPSKCWDYVPNYLKLGFGKGFEKGCQRMLQIRPGRFSSIGTAFETDGYHELSLRETGIATASRFLASRKQNHYKLFK
jgi:hypothetical protein